MGPIRRTIRPRLRTSFLIEAIVESSHEQHGTKPMAGFGQYFVHVLNHDPTELSLPGTPEHCLPSQLCLGYPTLKMLRRVGLFIKK